LIGNIVTDRHIVTKRVHARGAADGDDTGIPAGPPRDTHEADGTPRAGAWRDVVACWSIERRRRWADAAERHQAGGEGWREAEWSAFREVAPPTLVERVEAGEAGREPRPPRAADARWREEVALVPAPPMDTGIRPSPELPDRDRPGGEATWGLTRRWKVVELPRTAGVDRKDPVVKVTAEGWPAWFPVRESDRVIRARRAPAAPKEKKSRAKAR
jgi:hypothetical protein